MYFPLSYYHPQEGPRPAAPSEVPMRDPTLRRKIARSQGPCHLCGSSRLELEGEGWVADHLRPQVDGGQDTMANMAKAHSTCNKWRGAERITPTLYARIQKRRRLELYVQG